MEFRPNISTFDYICISRRSEHNTDLHNIFVEYMQDFVSVYRNKITEGLVLFKVPAKLVRLIVLNQINTAAGVKINNVQSSSKWNLDYNKEIHYQQLCFFSCRFNIKATSFKRD